MAWWLKILIEIAIYLLKNFLSKQSIVESKEVLKEASEASKAIKENIDKPFQPAARGQLTESVRLFRKTSNREPLKRLHSRFR